MLKTGMLRFRYRYVLLFCGYGASLDDQALMAAIAVKYEYWHLPRICDILFWSKLRPLSSTSYCVYRRAQRLYAPSP
ncbi:hypothetical protein FRC12_022895, partial [Ceratobasidium sp. 428]